MVLDQTLVVDFHHQGPRVFRTSRPGFSVTIAKETIREEIVNKSVSLRGINDSTHLYLLINQ